MMVLVLVMVVSRAIMTMSTERKSCLGEFELFRMSQVRN
jgi:hypothetical protein